MASAYPGGLDTFATNKANATAVTTDHPTHHNDLADAVNKIEAELGVTPSDTDATVAGRLQRVWEERAMPLPVADRGALDDYFDDGSLSGNWTTILPSGSHTITEQNGLLSVKYSGQTASDLAGVVKTLTGIGIGDSIETAVRVFGRPTDFTMAALVLADGAAQTSNIIGAYLQLQTSVGGVLVTRGGTWEAVGADIQIIGGAAVPWHTSIRLPWMYLRLTWTAANTFRFEVSPDGISWDTLGLADSARTLTPTHGGLGWTVWGGANAAINSHQYFRANL